MLTVKKNDVLSLTITGAERLDPIRVMIENHELGRGGITVTCYGQAWTGFWLAMGGDTVQEFIQRVSNDYLIGYFDSSLRRKIDDDNDANLSFVLKTIINLRRQDEINYFDARYMWDEAINSDDVKASCCDHLVGNHLLALFGDDPFYAGWPSVPNPKYQYLSRIIDAVRAGLKQLKVEAA